MNTRATIQNPDDEKIIQDISDLVYGLSHESSLSAQPGKISFNVVDDGKIDIVEGQIICIYYDYVEDNKEKTNNFFKGIVFSREFNQESNIAVVAYDQSRYLQNKDIYVVEGQTASELFESVCKDYKIKYNIVAPTTMKLSQQILDNESLYDIINYGINQEKILNNKWYYLRDNFGSLEFRDTDLALDTDKIIFSDSTDIFEFSFSSSIDEDTYNQVKIMQENRVSKKGKAVKSGGTVVSRDYGYSEDKETKAQWGILQYFGTSNKGYNQAQLDKFCNIILEAKNEPSKSLSITCVGKPTIKAGDRMFLKLDKISREIPEVTAFLITDCTHNFANNDHKMTLKLKSPSGGWRFK